MSALAGPREALLLSAQGEAGERTAATSEARLIRGLTTTVAEAGRAAGAGAVATGAGHRDIGGFSIQRAEGGTAAIAGTRGEEIPMQARTGVAGRDNTNLFVVTSEGGLQSKNQSDN